MNRVQSRRAQTLNTESTAVLNLFICSILELLQMMRIILRSTGRQPARLVVSTLARIVALAKNPAVYYLPIIHCRVAVLPRVGPPENDPLTQIPPYDRQDKKIRIGTTMEKRKSPRFGRESDMRARFLSDWEADSAQSYGRMWRIY